MGLRIRTNVASLNAQRRLATSTQAIQESSGKLASGKRINKAADDAAGLAISSNLGADIRSLNQAKRNANDGISLVQTAEGSLMETTSMLTRLRELSIQSASDTIGNTEREFLDKEFVALKDEIDRIANATEFNGTRLLIGENDVSDEIANAEGTFPLEIQIGKDYYEESDAIDQSNQVNVIKIDLNNINAFTSGDGSLDIGASEEGTRVNTKEAAQSSIMKMDDALVRVSEYRSYLGSIQNRLQSTINNLGVQTENLSAANSRIEDTDFAAETARYTSQKILQQAGSSVLAQANAQPQIALGLVNSL
ncbi:flagellin [Pseudobacteriovorax antillogorgiicola]|uniref:Flagellin n=1 Tax=Pseudobacteriovorax antillogorgiicola TaxID=1513793 RepID=A0A1Y6CNU9_9BACT|nr:flagellin [Pseudobacteriovorax antillogorgiicola]TCS44423.1 flagellin [Pseudobacteriovorax antillogorgiicola]SMF79057.1 flagellin [Pseudobacteriovorax antillogorgiicola]